MGCPFKTPSVFFLLLSSSFSFGDFGKRRSGVECEQGGREGAPLGRRRAHGKDALVSNLITSGQGRESAFAAAVLGDNALMEKAWQDTGMLAEAVLHAHAHGRPTLRTLVQAWNSMLQKEFEPTFTAKTDATSAFLASLEEPKLTSLADAEKKPPIEILPPGMASLSSPPITIKKPAAAQPAQIPALQEPSKPLMLEEAQPATTTAPPVTTPASDQPTTPLPTTDAAKQEDGSPKEPIIEETGSNQDNPSSEKLASENPVSDNPQEGSFVPENMTTQPSEASSAT